MGGDVELVKSPDQQMPLDGVESGAEVRKRDPDGSARGVQMLDEKM